jgi:glycerol-3-phosphate dehydrogenase
MDRGANVARLAQETFDVLVIGGGATGAGVALDAATRGLKVALVERDDFASGTSSRSTKLVHGGVRYLQAAITRLDRAQFRLVREGLAERAILLRIAPHLVHPLRLVVPAYSWRDLLSYRIGLWLYDRIAGTQSLARSAFLSVDETLRVFPTLRRNGLRGGIAYHDGQFDDARMVLALLSTAAQAGAAIANRVEVTALSARDGNLDGAELVDRVSGKHFSVRARAVINATGPHCDALRRLEDPGATPMLSTSRGSHLVFDAAWAPAGDGLLIPRTTDGRVLFLLPWQGACLLGTTDIAAEAESVPQPEAAEVEYLLDQLGQWLDPALTRNQVRAQWAGLRPLIGNPARATSRIVREHHIEVGPKGLVSIAGGKWTTYRRMAELTVDRTIAVHGLIASAPCRTREQVLIGAHALSPGLADALMQAHGLDGDCAQHLVASYGDQAMHVLAHAGPAGKRRLLPDHPYLEAEVLWARDREMALSADDVLARRLRLSFVDSVAATTATARVEALLAQS